MKNSVKITQNFQTSKNKTGLLFYSVFYLYITCIFLNFIFTKCIIKIKILVQKLLEKYLVYLIMDRTRVKSISNRTRIFCIFLLNIPNSLSNDIKYLILIEQVCSFLFNRRLVPFHSQFYYYACIQRFINQKFLLGDCLFNYT